MSMCFCEGENLGTRLWIRQVLLYTDSRQWSNGACDGPKYESEHVMSHEEHSYLNVVIVPPQIAVFGNLGIVWLQNECVLQCVCVCVCVCVHVCTYVGEVGWPATGENDGSSSGVERMTHIGVPRLIDGSIGITPIQFQHVYTPFCKCLRR